MDIFNCDVHDKKKLALFINKRNEWKRLLLEGSPHSIYNQIVRLLWNDAVFRTFNEARRLTIEHSSPNCGLNGPLLRLLDEGFVASQIMAIRRLTDRNFREPEKAVISLIRVIDDIKKHSNLITRENYLCYDGTSYDEPNFMDDPPKWTQWKTRQSNFDKMSGIPEDMRARSDEIEKSLIKHLEKNLRACDGPRRYANKFIAHASDPQTNPALSEEEKKITLDKLDECYRAILRTASFLGTVLLYEFSLGGLPTPQYDHLKNLEKPMVNKENKQKLYNYWRNRNQEVDDWENNLWDGMINK
ncbi:MAG: hypothetical protein FJ126_02725 [Deltaproteobacteria bacterium]|nr:hypothetical protein [Deltaproteobacteria bacterium]